MGQVLIIKTNGNLGRLAESTDGRAGFITTGVAVVGGLQLGQPYKLESLAQLETLGITKAHDLANKTLVWHHVRDFYKEAPAGTYLYLLVVAQTVTLDKLVDKTETDNAKKLLNFADGDFRMLGVAVSIPTGYTSVNTTGFDAKVALAVANAQVLADDEWSLFRPLSAVIIEGRDMNSTLSSVPNLRATSPSARNVSVVAFQDKTTAQLDALYNKHAAVGKALGIWARAGVNVSPGWVRNYNIVDKSTGEFVATALSSGTLVSDMPYPDFTTLSGKGVIIARRYPRKAGFYVNDTHTCTVITDDYAYIENNRVIDKGAILIYDEIINDLNMPIDVDASTGRLAPEICKYFENQAYNALNPMAAAGEISGRRTYVNPAQNILSSSLLLIEATITPKATARDIKITLGFENPFN